MRDTTFATPNARNDCVAAWSANPAPNSSPPMARIGRRATRRVTKPYVAWMTPELTAPIAARNGIASTPTWNSATTSRKIGGRMTAWA
jgi:hypothetical protein